MIKIDLGKRLIAVILACFIALSVFPAVAIAETVTENVGDTTEDWGDTVPDEEGGNTIPDEDLGEIPDEEDGTDHNPGRDADDGTGGGESGGIDYSTAVAVTSADDLSQALLD